MSTSLQEQFEQLKHLLQLHEENLDALRQSGHLVPPEGFEWPTRQARFIHDRVVEIAARYK